MYAPAGAGEVLDGRLAIVEHTLPAGVLAALAADHELEFDFPATTAVAQRFGLRFG